MGDEQLSTRDGVLVVEFPESFDEDRFETVFNDVIDRLQVENITAVVTHVRSTKPFGVDTFHAWEEAASRARTTPLERWAIVAPGTKRLSLKSQVKGGGFEVTTADDLDEVLAWAREGV